VVVCDDDDARGLLMGDFAEELHHLSAPVAVERGGGFVGKDEAGLVGQRAGDGHALLLAAGEGVGRLSARWPRLSRRPRRVAV